MKCLCASTRHVSRLLTRYYEAELRDCDITPAQFELLSIVYARPGLPQTELVEHLCVDQTTLSRNLQVLRKREWITRKPAKEDRRQSSWTLSAQGVAAWRQALPRWQRAQARMQETLGDDWQTVWTVLDRLTGAITPLGLQSTAHN